MPKTPLLAHLEQVRVTLNQQPVLQGINLSICQGERIALQGRNGAGKSSLLRVLRGELRPDQKNGGQITWYESAGQPGDNSPLAGRAISALVSPRLQDLYLRQAWQVPALDLVLAGIFDDYLLYTEPGPELRAEALRLADLLGVTQLLDKQLPTLSQGELRLILLLRALLRKPQLLLLDEADEGLDAQARTTFFAALEAILAEQPHLAVVVASHRQTPSFATRTVYLDKGHLTEQVLPTASAHSWSAADKKYPGINLVLADCSVYLSGQQILSDINLRIESGQNWMITGANGAGKTTLLRLLAGEESPALGGSISRYVQGRKLVALTEIQQAVQLVSPRLQSLYPGQSSVQEVVLSGLYGSIGLWREPEPQDLEQTWFCLRLAALEDLAERSFGSLSSGQMRKVLFARALIGQPALLLLDEPFAGLDAETRTDLQQFLLGQIQSGLQVVLVSHYPDDLRALERAIPNKAELSHGRLQIIA